MTRTATYYLNDEHIDGWDEDGDGYTADDLQTAVSNLTDTKPGDTLRVEITDLDELGRAVVVATHEHTIPDVEDLAEQLAQARQAEAAAIDALRRAAVTLIGSGAETEAGFGRRSGIDRMAVREWLGKRHR